MIALNPTLTNISVVQTNRLIDTALGGLGRSICVSTRIDGFGVNYRNLSSSTFQTAFQKMSDFFADHPDGRGSSIEMEVFPNQAVAAVANDATAYPWRDTKGYS